MYLRNSSLVLLIALALLGVQTLAEAAQKTSCALNAVKPPRQLDEVQAKFDPTFVLDEDPSSSTVNSQSEIVPSDTLMYTNEQTESMGTPLPTETTNYLDQANITEALLNCTQANTTGITNGTCSLASDSASSWPTEILSQTSNVAPAPVSPTEVAQSAENIAQDAPTEVGSSSSDLTPPCPNKNAPPAGDVAAADPGDIGPLSDESPVDPNVYPAPVMSVEESAAGDVLAPNVQTSMVTIYIVTTPSNVYAAATRSSSPETEAFNDVCLSNACSSNAVMPSAKLDRPCKSNFADTEPTMFSSSSPTFPPQPSGGLPVYAGTVTTPVTPMDTATRTENFPPENSNTLGGSVVITPVSRDSDVVTNLPAPPTMSRPQSEDTGYVPTRTFANDVSPGGTKTRRSATRRRRRRRRTRSQMSPLATTDYLGASTASNAPPSPTETLDDPISSLPTGTGGPTPPLSSIQTLISSSPPFLPTTQTVANPPLSSFSPVTLLEPTPPLTVVVSTSGGETSNSVLPSVPGSNLPGVTTDLTPQPTVTDEPSIQPEFPVYPTPPPIVTTDPSIQPEVPVYPTPPPIVTTDPSIQPEVPVYPTPPQIVSGAFPASSVGAGVAVGRTQPSPYILASNGPTLQPSQAMSQPPVITENPSDPSYPASSYQQPVSQRSIQNPRSIIMYPNDNSLMPSVTRQLAPANTRAALIAMQNSNEPSSAFREQKNTNPTGQAYMDGSGSQSAMQGGESARQPQATNAPRNMESRKMLPKQGVANAQRPAGAQVDARTKAAYADSNSVPVNPGNLPKQAMSSKNQESPKGTNSVPKTTSNQPNSAKGMKNAPPDSPRPARAARSPNPLMPPIARQPTTAQSSAQNQQRSAPARQQLVSPARQPPAPPERSTSSPSKKGSGSSGGSTSAKRPPRNQL